MAPKDPGTSANMARRARRQKQRDRSSAPDRSAPAKRTRLRGHHDAALAAIHEHGLHFSAIEADGRFHRGRGRVDAEWYVANAGTTSTGKHWLMLSAGDFRETGGDYVATLVWRSWKRDELTGAERKEITATHKTTKKATAARLSEDQEAARQRACDIWHAAEPGEHPYLNRKRLPAGNTRVHGDRLLVPLYTIPGDFVSLQSIRPNGSKRFLSGARAAGTYHPIGFYFLPQQTKVYVAEGWATAAAIAHVKGMPAVAAFSAGNLRHVAADIRAQSAAMQIVVVADNDAWTPGNPGLRQAHRAAAAVEGRVIVPEFDGLGADGRPTDFWDYFHLTGSL